MDNTENTIHFGRELGIAANQFRRVMDRIIERRVGLTAAQAKTLHFIMLRSRDGDVYQKDIEHTFDLRSPSVTGMLKQLETKGLIRREANAVDGRLKRIVLTEAATDIQEQIYACITGMEEAIADSLTEGERAEFLAILQKVNAAISEQDRQEGEQHGRKDRKECTDRKCGTDRK